MFQAILLPGIERRSIPDNNVARNKVALNLHDTLRDFVAGNKVALLRATKLPSVSWP